MKSAIHIGDVHSFNFVVGENKTVPALYPESEIFQSMPNVLATGFMVGLMEWACTDALKNHLEDGEGSLGITIDVNHIAPTLPGQTVTVTVTCDKSEGNRIGWRVSARDEVDLIGEGRHDRAVVRWEGFNRRLAEKRAKLA